MAPQAWMVGEMGEDLDGHKEFLPLCKLQDAQNDTAYHCFTCLISWVLAFLEIGVLYWHLDPKKPESEEELSNFRKERGYNYMDLIEICPEKLENYEEKAKNFFREHMHADEEVRYCLEGSRYVDVRDKDDKWIRVWIKEGDMIVLPAGIYHRFTLDSANYVKKENADAALHRRASLDFSLQATGGPSCEARVCLESDGEYWWVCKVTYVLESVEPLVKGRMC
ncbi:hypothetical protein ACP70R_019282 [Stipagrostis hirtigluma subsp. patula]